MMWHFIQGVYVACCLGVELWVPFDSPVGFGLLVIVAVALIWRVGFLWVCVGC